MKRSMTSQAQMERFGSNSREGKESVMVTRGVGRGSVSRFVVAMVAAAMLAVCAPGAAWADFGGPDQYGYLYIDSNEPDGPTFNFEDISGTGTALGLDDDDVAPAIPIGFTFFFYGKNYTTVDISSNGFISFSTLANSYLSNGCPIDSTLPQNAIYAFWDNLDPSVAGAEVYYETLGTAPHRRFIVQWDNVQFFGADPDDVVTFQIILFENRSDILVQYIIESMAPLSFRTTGDEATFGIEDSSGTIALQYEGCDTASTITDELAIRYFLPEEADVRVKKLADNTVVRAGEEIVYRIVIENFGPGPAYGVYLRDLVIPNRHGNFLGDLFSSMSFSVSGSPGVITTFEDDDPVMGMARLEARFTEPLPPKNEDDEGNWVVRIILVPKVDMTVCDEAEVYMETWSVTSDYDTSNNSDTVCTTVLASADLAVVKDTSPAGQTNVTAGDTLTYEVVVTNDGPSDADGVVVQDSLPAGVSIVSIAATTGTYQAGVPGSSPLVWNVGNLAVGASETLTVQVLVNPAVPDGAILNNDVVVSSEAYDPDTSDNAASYPVTVDTEADLSLLKLAIGTPIAGEVIHYEYQISNLGPSVSRNVVLRDFLPDEVEFIDATLMYNGVQLPITVTQGSNALFVELGDIPPTGTLPYVVFVNVLIMPDVPVGTNITNSADVLLTDTTDPDLDNSRDEATVVSLAEADLEIVKTGPVTAAAGGQIQYTVTVTNHGSSDAQAVTVVDTLPAGVTFVNSSCGAVEAPVGTLTIAVGMLAAGETFQCEIVGVVDNFVAAGTILTNSANVATTTTDPVPGNNDDAYDTYILNAADLTVKKLVDGDDVQAGDTFTYTIIVENLGPSPAAPVYLRDDLISSLGGNVADNFTIVGVTRDPVLNDAALPAPPSQPDGGLTMEFVLNEPLLPKGEGGVGRWIIQIQVMPLKAQRLCNEVEVFQPADPENDSADPDLSNNSDLICTVIGPTADLSITKVTVPAGITGVDAGDTVTYQVEVTNSGPGEAQGVVVQDSLPAGVTVLTVAVSQGAYQAGVPGSSPLVWNVGNLAVGASAVMDITVLVDLSVPDAAMLHNDVAVSSEAYDPNLADNTASYAIQVVNAADLDITKTVSDDPVEAGATMTYQITVENTGPMGITARNVVVTDWLPEGVMLAGTLPSQGVIGGDPGGRPLIWAVGDLADGETATLDIEVIVSPDLPDGTVLTNDAAVTSDTEDPDPTNNSATVPTTVVNTVPADVSVKKLVDSDTVYAGQPFTYTIIVENWGPNPAYPIVLRDDLVSSLGGDAADNFIIGVPVSDRDATLTVLAPVPGGYSFEFSLDDSLEPKGEGGDGRWVVQVEVTPLLGQVLCNEVEVFRGPFEGLEGVSHDPDLSNNSDLICTEVLPAADISIEKTAVSNPDPAVASGTITYTLTVTNLGPSPATNVVVSDVLPADVTFVEVVSVSKGAVNPGVPGDPTQPLIWNVNTLDVNDTETLVFTVWIHRDVEEGDLIINSASVASEVYDPDNTNNLDTVVVEISGLSLIADLTVKKLVNNVEMVAGDTIRYTIVVENLGPGIALDVALRDELFSSHLGTFSDHFIGSIVVVDDPDREDTILPVITGTPPGGFSFEATLDEPLEPKGLDGGGRWMITVEVTPRIAQTICNEVQVFTVPDDPKSEDPNVYNNSDVICTLVFPAAGLAIDKTDSADPVQAGQTFDYTITVMNSGPDTARNTVVQDYLPAGITLLGTSASAGAVLSGTPGDPFRPLRWFVGNVAVGGSETLLIQVRVNQNVPDGTILFNDAFVSSDSEDPDSSDNVATQATTVSALADLAIVKSYNPSSVPAGELLSYTLTVTNNGPSTAKNVTVTDYLPTEVIYLSSGVVGGLGTTSYAAGPNSVTCFLGDIPAGDSRTVLIEVMVKPDTPAGTITNSASVTSTTSDPVAGNNSDSEDTTITRVADLEIIKTGEPMHQAVGQRVTYTIVVRNLGPSDAVNVVVDDDLPVDGFGTLLVQYENSTPPSTFVPPKTRRWTIPVLEVGEERTFTIQARVSLGASPLLTIDNSADVTSSTSDPDLANNVSVWGLRVLAKLPDLTGVWKSIRSYFGGRLIYAVITVQNVGDADAEYADVEIHLSNNGTSPVRLLSYYVIERSGWWNPVTGLLAGQKVDVPVFFFTWTSNSGKYLMGFIDPYNVVTELDEDNNVIVRQIL